MFTSIYMLSNKMNLINKIQKSPLLAFIKSEPTFLTGSLAVCPSAPVQGEAGGRGVWGEFRPPRPVSSVRIFSNRHRHVLHSAKLKEVASALRASAWYFPARIQAFLRGNETVRSAMRKFLCESTESRSGGTEPIFFLSLSAKG